MLAFRLCCVGHFSKRSGSAEAANAPSCDYRRAGASYQAGTKWRFWMWPTRRDCRCRRNRMRLLSASHFSES